MWNAGSVPARMIEIIGPAGFENFFRELAELISAGPPDAGQVPALAGRYGLQFGQPEWLPGIISFGLTVRATPATVAAPARWTSEPGSLS